MATDFQRDYDPVGCKVEQLLWDGFVGTFHPVVAGLIPSEHMRCPSKVFNAGVSAATQNFPRSPVLVPDELFDALFYSVAYPVRPHINHAIHEFAPQIVRNAPGHLHHALTECEPGPGLQLARRINIRARVGSKESLPPLPKDVVQPNLFV